jgi:hypothetical protein
VDGTYPDNYVTNGGFTNTGLQITGNCNTSGAAPTGNIVLTTTEAKGNEGAKCGPDNLTAALPVCVITVTAGTGEIDYVATAA